MDRYENRAEFSVIFTDGRSVTADLGDLPRIASALIAHLCEVASDGVQGRPAAASSVTVTDSTGAEVTLTSRQAYSLATGLLRGVSEIIQATRRVADPSLN